MSKTQSLWIVTTLVALGAPLGALRIDRGNGSISAAEPARSEAVDSRSARKSGVARDDKPNIGADDVSALVASNTRFAVDMYRALFDSNRGNVLMSPYSIAVALAMIQAGAGGQTATQMAAAMGWPLPADRLALAFDALELQLASRSSDGIAIRLAQSLWAEPRLRFEKPFLDTLSRDFGAGVRLTDFETNPEGTRRRINAWASDATNGKIREFIGRGGPPPGTVVAMYNAVYFRGEWSSPFDVESTTDAPFWPIDGQQADVPTMRQRLWAAYATTDAYDAVELPYKGDAIAMDIVMPKTAFATFEADLSADKLSTTLKRLNFGPVRLWMPRFRIAGDSIGLKMTLQNLGIRRIFEPDADFAPMATDPQGSIRIGGLFHKAYIAVSEKGTEAAAVTGVDGVTAARPGSETTICIDHPFLFVLRDIPTGTILFIGQVTDPRYRE